MKNRDWISATDALNYFPGWGEVTRDRVRSEFSRMGAEKFRVNSHGFWNSVQVFAADDQFVADLMKTKVWFVPEAAPADAVDEGRKNAMWSIMLEGVTRADRSERASRTPEPALLPLCDTCFLHHPVGECDR